MIRRKLPALPPRRDRSEEFASWTPPQLHRGVYAPSELKPAPKEPEPVRDEGYRRLVALLPCIICGAHGSSQAAHGNRGKGLGLKTSDLTCFPLCHEGANGCHAKWDRYQFGGADKQAEDEVLFAAATRHVLKAYVENFPNSPDYRCLERVGVIVKQEVAA